MLTNELNELILIEPAIETEADELRVLSAFFSGAFVNEHLQRLRGKGLSPKINLTVGWSPQAFRNQEQALKLLLDEYGDHFTCTYYDENAPIHSKVYVWLKDGKPLKAFHGSANYSANAFNYAKQKNTMAECSAIEAMDYINSFAGSYKAVNKEFLENLTRPSPISAIDQRSILHDENTVILDFLTPQGDLPQKSGLNWGMPRGTARRPYRAEGSRQGYDEAYIPIEKKIHQVNPGFFPPPDQHFIIDTDDDKTFFAVIAQQNAKAMQTPRYAGEQNNAWLGRYFRDRLGVPYGTYVKKEHLEAYGRTYVKITKRDEDSFHLDFSKPNDN